VTDSQRLVINNPRSNPRTATGRNPVNWMNRNGKKPSARAIDPWVQTDDWILSAGRWDPTIQRGRAGVPVLARYASGKRHRMFTLIVANYKYTKKSWCRSRTGQIRSYNILGLVSSVKLRTNYFDLFATPTLLHPTSIQISKLPLRWNRRTANNWYDSVRRDWSKFR